MKNIMTRAMQSASTLVEEPTSTPIALTLRLAYLLPHHTIYEISGHEAKDADILFNFSIPYTRSYIHADPIAVVYK